MPEVVCQRCGFQWTLISNRKPNTRCASCRAQKVQTVQTVRGKCYPWHGHFGPDMITPINENGQEVLPGLRKCGNLDCVNPAHIERKRDGTD